MRRHPKPSELRALLPRLAGRTVAVVGDVVVDEYVHGQTDRISREAPVLIVRHEATTRTLGGAGNAAANVASLGGRAVALGVVGDDEAGRAIGELCDRAGVEPRLVRLRGEPTETKTRILAGGINTTRQQMLRLDRSRNGPLLAEAEAKLVAGLRRLAKAADAVLVSDYGSGVLGPAVIAELVALARGGCTVCVDSRYNLRAFRGVRVAKPNEPELAAATGLPVGSAAHAVRAGKALRRALGCDAVLVTRGRSGMALVEKGRSPALIPVHGEQEAVDVTGAGDTVIAGLALALAAGAGLEEAARLANVAGGIVVRKPGTATVSLGELDQELSR